MGYIVLNRKYHKKAGEYLVIWSEGMQPYYPVNEEKIRNCL
jgi:hypothetical protein